MLWKRCRGGLAQAGFGGMPHAVRERSAGLVAGSCRQGRRAGRDDISSFLIAASALHAGQEIGVQLLPVIEDATSKAGEGDVQGARDAVIAERTDGHIQICSGVGRGEPAGRKGRLHSNSHFKPPSKKVFRQREGVSGHMVYETLPLDL